MTIQIVYFFVVIVIVIGIVTVYKMKNVPVAQRIRRETTNLKIAGSNPVGDIVSMWFCGVVG